MESYDEFARRARIMTEVHAEHCEEGETSKPITISSNSNTVFNCINDPDRLGKAISANIGTSDTTATASAVKKKAKDAKICGKCLNAEVSERTEVRVEG